MNHSQQVSCQRLKNINLSHKTKTLDYLTVLRITIPFHLGIPQSRFLSEWTCLVLGL